MFDWLLQVNEVKS